MTTVEKVTIYDIRDLIQDTIKARYPEANTSSEDLNHSCLIIDVDIRGDSGSITIDWT